MSINTLWLGRSLTSAVSAQSFKISCSSGNGFWLVYEDLSIDFPPKSRYGVQTRLRALLEPAIKLVYINGNNAAEGKNNIKYSSSYPMNWTVKNWFVLNNYWMRLSKPRSVLSHTTRGFDNSWCHAKPEFNICFIIHFSHNSSSETEAKRSAILFQRRTFQGAW